MIVPHRSQYQECIRREQARCCCNTISKKRQDVMVEASGKIRDKVVLLLDTK